MILGGFFIFSCRLVFHNYVALKQKKSVIDLDVESLTTLDNHKYSGKYYNEEESL